MKKFAFILLFFVGLSTYNHHMLAAPWQSNLLKVAANGKLTYHQDADGFTLPDFSYAGYKGGGVDIPDVPTVKTISPIAGDNTAHIQDAINYVGSLPLNPEGIRGALLLEAGTYDVYGSLNVKYDGVVLRGVGEGSNPANSTIIYARGNTPHQRTVLVLGNNGSRIDGRKIISNTQTNITDDIVMSGSNSFTVENPALYTVGDRIIIRHPSTQAWIDAIDRGGVPYPDPYDLAAPDERWTEGKYEILYHRYIKKISGNVITVDAPVFYTLNKSLSQSYIYKPNMDGLVYQVGLENLRIDIENAGGVDEDHAWQSARFKNCEDAWAKNCTFLHFGQSGIITEACYRSTFTHCTANDPVGVVTGERGYNFNTYYYSQLNLFSHCYARGGRHHYVSNGEATVSGNVFLRSTSDAINNANEGHRQWTQGMLYDNHKEVNLVRDFVLGLYNRVGWGTGHGWAAVNSVLWNCDVNRTRGVIGLQKPPTAQNYAIGCMAKSITKKPLNATDFTLGYVEGHNKADLQPQSIYEAQLQERLLFKEQLATTTVDILPKVMSNSATVYWTPVEGAAAYVINLYQDGVLVSNYLIEGNQNTNLNISGLLPESTYTYGVIAQNSRFYLESEESDPIPFTTNSSVYLDMTFDYEDGALLDKGAADGWTSTGDKNQWASDFNVESPALTYSNAGGTYRLSGLGKTLDIDYITPLATNDRASEYRVIKPFVNDSIDEGVVYVSFLYTPNGNAVSGTRRILILTSDEYPTKGWQVWSGTDDKDTSFKLGATHGTNSYDEIGWGANMSHDRLSETFLLVMKMELNGLENFKQNRAYLYLNPEIDSVEEPEPYAISLPIASNSNHVKYLRDLKFLVTGNAYTGFKLSGVRISNTWEDAVRGQNYEGPLSAPVVGTASDVKAQSFVANWQKVDDAVGYSVQVYKGGVLKQEVELTGQSTESAVISNLWHNTSYTYTVKAIGDGGIYSDSEASAASTVILTPSANLTALHTDFSEEAVWGPAYDLTKDDDHPSGNINDFYLKESVVSVKSAVGFRADSLNNSIQLKGRIYDKETQEAHPTITFPILQASGQVELYVSGVGANRSYYLQKTTDGETWDNIATLTTPVGGQLYHFIVPVEVTDPVQLRFRTNSPSLAYVYQIIVRPTNPSLLDTPTVGNATAVKGTYFTANWTKVSNATGYAVHVYNEDDGGARVSIVNAVGQATESVDIIGLEPETSYSYKVLALGDAYEDYADSYISEASSSFITGPTTGLYEQQAADLKISNNIISSSQEGLFEIYNMQGAKVYQIDNVQTATVDLATGIYILRFTGQSGRQEIHKLIFK